MKVIKKSKQKFGARGAPQILGAFGASFRGHLGAPNYLKNLTRAMMIPNMCLVLKLDKGKVVSIANEQNHRRT